MTEEYLNEYKKKISKLSKSDMSERNEYLKGLNSGRIQGPLTGYASIDKPWCNYYSTTQLSEETPKRTAYNYMFLKLLYFALPLI